MKQTNNDNKIHGIAISAPLKKELKKLIIENDNEKIEKAKRNELKNSNPFAYTNITSKNTEIDKQKSLNYILTATLETQGNKENSVKFLEEIQKKSDENINEVGLAKKTIQVSDLESGGITIPTEYSNEIIGSLIDEVVMLKNGLKKISMDMGGFSKFTKTQNTTVYWGQELASTTESDIKFGEKRLNPKNLSGLTPISNAAIKQGIFDLQQLAIEDLKNQISLAIDSAIITGTGSESEPRGIYYTMASGNKETGSSSESEDYENADIDIAACLNNLGSNNIKMENCIWIMSYNAYIKLMSIRDGNGNYAYPELYQTEPKLKGFKIAITNSLSNDEMYFVDLSQMLLGDTGAPKMVIIPYGNYTDSDGTQHNGAQENFTLLRADYYCDFMMFHDKAAAHVNTLNWA